MLTEMTDRFPGDATRDEIRTAIGALKLIAQNDDLDYWQRIATLARWIADAANWQVEAAEIARYAGVATCVKAHQCAACVEKIRMARLADLADKATADASMPRDPVELEERITAEFCAELDEDDDKK
jgi:hypothetical protein